MKTEKLKKLQQEDVNRLLRASNATAAIGLKNYSQEIINLLDAQTDILNKLVKYC